MSRARRIYDATWGRLFASFYDRMLAATEKAGLTERRAALLAGASGRTLELGAGTGLNLRHYPDAVTELVLTEPFEPMAKRLRRRLAELGRDAEVVEAPAEALPFADESFDTVVSTLVLCTVGDPSQAVAEIARVLRPGGRFLYLEHVVSPEPRVRRWQDRLHGPWRAFGHGCHCNRDTVGTIGASGLQLGDVERGEMPKSPPIVRPLAIGSASRPG